ncbi:MAG: putative secreted protein [Herbinix sp.]|nr:putative secreted protein [Herbinix sp.]MDF2804702.1 putative secreted protein [Anaerocolumna sp.]
MRKFIATSVCTILLSLLGASGLNQNSFNILNESSANQYTTDVEQNVTNIEGKNLINTNKVADTEELIISVNADQKGDTPNDLHKTEVKGATVINVEAVKTCSNSSKASCKKDKNCGTNNCTEASKCKKNGKSLVYKNVDLSKCKNSKEVVKKLQANGFKNVTLSNIKDNKALAGIISNISKNTSCKGSCKTEVKKEAAKPVVTKATETKATTTNATTTKTKANTTANTTTTAATNTSTTKNTSMSSYASQVLQLVNKERAKQGLSALTTESTLTEAANVRAKETVSSFSHTRPNGTSFSTVLKEFNISYRTAGENIAYGQKTPQEVVTGWMNSPGHRANILNASYGKIGIGVYKASNGTIYWSQLFTN